MDYIQQHDTIILLSCKCPSCLSATFPFLFYVHTLLLLLLLLVVVVVVILAVVVVVVVVLIQDKLTSAICFLTAEQDSVTV